ncbi:MAG TPA: glyoxylate/hydroxypyruvate reductase A [Robiginitalea sp.]|nr:glyoxylate/hydroxypyruvate reductase A [Robiginitalea sp.]
MALVVIRNDDKAGRWVNAFKQAHPGLEVFDYNQPHPREAVRMAAVWKHPPGSLSGYPNLAAVHGLGAGVDFILEDPDLKPEWPVLRVTDPYLAADMAEYILAQVLAHLRQLPGYHADKVNKVWKPLPYGRIGDVTVGLMGLGTLGRAAARLLSNAGFACSGWTRQSSPETGFPVFSGQQGLKAFLASAEILVCLLPLTPQTRGILNRETFRAMPDGAYLINVARGPLLAEDHLLEALDGGKLSGACLDVFSEEPLPAAHPFWAHPSVQITPHIASVSEPASVVPQILANYQALLRGGKLHNRVSRGLGY